MKIPPILSYINIDYYEVLLNISGYVMLDGRQIDLSGIGKFDHNFNL